MANGIPFDLKLWQEKKYQVETRDGMDVKDLGFYALLAYPLHGYIQNIGDWFSWDNTGRLFVDHAYSPFDLFLLVPEPEPEKNEKDELLELAWGIIANASGGDWIRESAEWRKAAAKWRDRYHAVIPNAGQAIEVPGAVATIPEPAPTLTPEEADYVLRSLHRGWPVNISEPDASCSDAYSNAVRKLRQIAERKD